jgi:hypothetical protein
MSNWSDTPILPYAGTSGWSGSETSRERAITADRSGATTLRQKQTITHVKHQGERGLTWYELSEITNWHHGTSSGALSVLNKAGRLVRLHEKRNKSSIYVTPEFVNGRKVAERKKGKLTLTLTLSAGVHVDDIKTDINCESLLRLAELGLIKDEWSWSE